MGGKKRRVSIIIWIMLSVIIRVLYFILNKGIVLDKYSFYSHAMIQSKEQAPVLTSGLSYVYSKLLSLLLRFTGNRITAVFVLQLVLQIAFLICFFLAIEMLWGTVAGFISGYLLSICPYILFVSNQVVPDHLFLLHFSIILLLLALFHQRTKQIGWYRSNLCELYLLVTGFYLGMISIWNYLSILLWIIMIYILICNYRIVQDKLWLQELNDEIIDEKRQAMPTLSQALILVFGMLIGMFATLMKYTGLTGYTITGQISWLIAQYRELPGVCQGVGILLGVCIAGCILTGFFAQLIMNTMKQNKERKKILSEEEPVEELIEEQLEEPKLKKKPIKEKTMKEQPMKEQPVEKEKEFFMAEDGRKIAFLDNPLPVPKKHVPKEIDFDYEIEEGSDFDIP